MSQHISRSHSRSLLLPAAHCLPCGSHFHTDNHFPRCSAHEQTTSKMAKLQLDPSFLNSKVEFISDSLRFEEYDSLVVVGEKFVTDERVLPRFQLLNIALKAQLAVDSKAGDGPTVLNLLEGLGVKRAIFSPTGPLNRDIDDVRRYEEAAFEGVKRALAAGSIAPVVFIDVDAKVRADPQYEQADLVGILGALRAVYVPIEVRETNEKKAVKATRISFLVPDATRVGTLERLATALEAGRIVARDIGGSDPERMAAPRVVEYVKETFSGSKNVKIEVIDDQSKLEKEYPLLGAVNRAASVIPRHHARVIFLEYVGEGEITETVFLVGKGITYDTGGADVKAGGHMAGMHRDKCGAAAVAGFFKTLSLVQPKGIRVVGSMSMVRNSIGENCYVADEIITSRAGVRVRVGNTDAEGRMVMTDLIAYMKEKIVKENVKNPQIYTIATLTGHVCLAFGDAYSGVLDNGPARKNGNSRLLFDLAARIAEPVELSTIRREDFKLCSGPSEYEDLLQCNNAPSSQTARGHQLPAAFMIAASGLDKHGLDSALPIPYTHIDIAGSAGPFPGVPRATPILMLAARHIFPHLDNRMLLKPFDFSSKYAALPFEYYCPSSQKGGKLDRMVFKKCGVYFATQIARKNHHCAPDDQEEDYNDISDDDEVAAHIPASPDDIPISSGLTNWLRSDLVEDRFDLE
ncbi:putative aminopeptidase W07G4.4 [Hypsibius exemplaris]|uniref:Aminopeptidase W07G4.4 n=1 Tax=Hypsibius exemplaris TaxID=2072580 RepID=A0A1W0XFR4_HYPEX|nr:putative aminopeptidase W07G4.4 [Hypsibius exemplaris]